MVRQRITHQVVISTQVHVLRQNVKAIITTRQVVLLAVALDDACVRRKSNSPLRQQALHPVAVAVVVAVRHAL